MTSTIGRSRPAVPRLAFGSSARGRGSPVSGLRGPRAPRTIPHPECRVLDPCNCFSNRVGRPTFKRCTYVHMFRDYDSHLHDP